MPVFVFDLGLFVSFQAEAGKPVETAGRIVASFAKWTLDE
jgi:hypothetical protein